METTMATESHTMISDVRRAQATVRRQIKELQRCVDQLEMALVRNTENKFKSREAQVTALAIIGERVSVRLHDAGDALDWFI